MSVLEEMASWSTRPLEGAYAAVFIDAIMARSVIRETVSLDTDAPYTSAKCALISPVVRPLAYSDSTTSPRSATGRSATARSTPRSGST